MATNPKIATTTRNNMLDELVADIGASGLVNIYSGTQPAGPGTAISSQTLLAVCTLAATAGTVASGVLTFGSITADSSANASGIASWFRITTSGGTAIYDGTIGTSSADMIVNTTTVTAGGPFSITSGTITFPGG
jgi:hypothetical protein